LFLDYSITTTYCDHPELSIDPSRNFQKNNIRIDQFAEVLITETIDELIRASNASEAEIPRPSIAGFRNQIKTSDSSLTIDDFPSISWTTFDKLTTEVLKE